jgi:hypothetical protein
MLDKPLLDRQVNQLAAMVLKSASHHGWLCGVPLNVKTPGLMIGSTIGINDGAAETSM